MTDFDTVVMEMMQEFPMEAIYIKQSEGSYNPATGTVSPSTTLETPVQALLFDLTLQSNGFSVKFGTLIEAGDKNLLVRPPNKTDPLAPALVVNPATDRVVVAGVTYKIVTFKEVNPTGTDPVLFDLYIRR